MLYISPLQILQLLANLNMDMREKGGERTLGRKMNINNYCNNLQSVHYLAAQC